MLDAVVRTILRIRDITVLFNGKCGGVVVELEAKSMKDRTQLMCYVSSLNSFDVILMDEEVEWSRQFVCAGDSSRRRKKRLYQEKWE
jgi:nitrate reductase NapAB chaperone NapD